MEKHYSGIILYNYVCILRWEGYLNQICQEHNAVVASDAVDHDAKSEDIEEHTQIFNKT